MIEIVHYLTEKGEDPYNDWTATLRDRKALARITVRVNRVSTGNFGDHKAVGEGVSELRIDVGAGYRVYLARWGDEIVVLLGGGDKTTQNDDIATAKARWANWKSRQKKG